ncbi:TspO/MBR family protein [Olleya marilimosa]|uniref:Tryptophan-rich sensory protein n=1 Tax=Olleya marilimosa TaxID=272164 RepID=A0ABR8LPZ8_9FLAO|nr:TspO/MBR family protein [Olleya marilimosa]MBD3862296.1 tryptophan-rich sensory protein [Olleya marilimosa]MBD3889791.1 tryptophan-rich sensory protein [Olleya marilimosa]
MKQLLLFLIFGVINFGGLAFGSWLMDNGPLSDWYTNLNQAPWTPPGWIFGVAWTIIMLCFSVYLSKLFTVIKTKQLITVYILQVILNVSWNFIFFNLHQVLFALITILLLTVVIFYMFFKYKKTANNISFLLLPYMVWLLIATSLNAYILIYN